MSTNRTSPVQSKCKTKHDKTRGISKFKITLVQHKKTMYNDRTKNKG